MTNEEQIIQDIQTWSGNYNFIKQVHLMPSPENVVDLVFELNPVTGDDDDRVTWANEEHNIRKSLENLLKTNQIKLRLRNELMYSGIDKEVEDKGILIL